MVVDNQCCTVPNCLAMLCAVINALYERATGQAVIEAENGQERYKYISMSSSGLEALAYRLQRQCGTEETAPLVGALSTPRGMVQVCFSDPVCIDCTPGCE